MTGTAPTQTAEVVLTSLSNELYLLSQKIETLEQAIIPLLNHTAKGSVSHAERLQEIDSILQTTNALAGFVSQLAKIRWPTTTIDIVSSTNSIPLQNLKDRLRFGAAVTDDAPKPSGGRPILF